MSQRISLGGLASMNLRIELKWEQWSPCTACRPYKSLRTRQGHCYLSKIVLNKSVSMPNFESADMTNFYGTKMVMTGVVDDLNILFNQEPFSLEGVRCWSVIPLIAGLDAYGSPCTGDAQEWAKLDCELDIEISLQLGPVRKCSTLERAILCGITCSQVSFFGGFWVNNMTVLMSASWLVSLTNSLAVSFGSTTSSTLSSPVQIFVPSGETSSSPKQHRKSPLQTGTICTTSIGCRSGRRRRSSCG